MHWLAMLPLVAIAVQGLLIAIAGALPSPGADESLSLATPASTADILILNEHFQRTGYYSFDQFTTQLRRLKNRYGLSKLPKTLLWRIAPPAIRGDNNHPSVNDNLQALQQIASLYPANAGPKMVFYPDVESEEADAAMWGTNTQEKAAINADPTKAVTEYMPRDLAIWNAACKAASIPPFTELILEVQGAPMAPKQGGTSPTLVALRDNPLLKGIVLSLTPDFSVLEGRCKTNLADDCSLITNYTGVSAGSFYAQIYNLYTPNDGQNQVLTDVTPWGPASAGANCLRTNEDQKACKANKCCTWRGEISLNVSIRQSCVPNPDIPHCFTPETGLCLHDDPISGCAPSVGHSIYSPKYPPSQVGTIVATIVTNRILLRCNPGGAGIEALGPITFWDTFKMIFSYEPWSTSGAPLYLMGNPGNLYDNTMWTAFLAAFKTQIKQGLATRSPGSLCHALAGTVDSHMAVGVYWARMALDAWLETPSPTPPPPPPPTPPAPTPPTPPPPTPPSPPPPPTPPPPTPPPPTPPAPVPPPPTPPTPTPPPVCKCSILRLWCCFGRRRRSVTNILTPGGRKPKKSLGGFV